MSIIYKFYYNCLNAQGERMSGVAIGTDILEVRQRLQALDLYPEQIKQKRVLPGMSQLRRSQLIFLFRQMAFSLEHGISLLETLELQYQETKNKKVALLLEHLLQMVRQGYSLLQALHLAPFEMPYIVYEWVAVGEERGDLGGCLWSLVEHLQKQNQFRKKLKSQLLYPTLVFFMILLFFNILLFFFFPFMAEVYTEFQIEVPFLLALGMKISQGIRDYWLWHLGIFFSLFCILIYYRKQLFKALQLKILALMSKIPFLKELWQLLVFVPFASFFGELLKSGVGINRIFFILSKEASFQSVQASFLSAMEKIKEGHSLNRAMKNFSFIPQVALKTLSLAEYSGNIAETFLFLADYYERLLQEKMTKCIKILEPLLIVFLGGLILTLILTLYLPIIDSYEGMFQF